MENNLKPYIIGETAYNHEGDINYLYKMIDDISEIKLNAVKFHLLLNAESYMQKRHPLMEKIKKWILNEKQWDDVIDYSHSKGLDIICLCDDVESVEFILKNKKMVKALEVHASGLNDFFLLDAVSKFNGYIILGIGSSTVDEITYAVDFLKNKGKSNIALMYGFQGYPTKYTDISLYKMIKIKNLFNLLVGYADHTAFDDPKNEIISAMAAVMGTNILEKHFTLDYGKERVDYHSAVGKEQMIRIKELMELALMVHGDGSLKMSKSELEYGNIGPMKKAIVAKDIIRKGERLTLDNLWFKRTVEDSPIKQNLLLQLIGLEAKRDIQKDEIINSNKIEYKFKKLQLERIMHIKDKRKK